MVVGFRDRDELVTDDVWNVLGQQQKRKVEVLNFKGGKEMGYLIEMKTFGGKN